jgi:hypothetical protein
MGPLSLAGLGAGTAPGLGMGVTRDPDVAVVLVTEDAEGVDSMVDCARDELVAEDVSNEELDVVMRLLVVDELSNVVMLLEGASVVTVEMLLGVATLLIVDDAAELVVLLVVAVWLASDELLPEAELVSRRAAVELAELTASVELLVIDVSDDDDEVLEVLALVVVGDVVVESTTRFELLTSDVGLAELLAMDDTAVESATGVEVTDSGVEVAELLVLDSAVVAELKPEPAGTIDEGVDMVLTSVPEVALELELDVELDAEVSKEVEVVLELVLDAVLDAVVLSLVIGALEVDDVENVKDSL